MTAQEFPAWDSDVYTVSGRQEQQQQSTSYPADIAAKIDALRAAKIPFDYDEETNRVSSPYNQETIMALLDQYYKSQHEVTFDAPDGSTVKISSSYDDDGTISVTRTQSETESTTRTRTDSIDIKVLKTALDDPNFDFNTVHANAIGAGVAGLLGIRPVVPQRQVAQARAETPQTQKSVEEAAREAIMYALGEIKSKSASTSESAPAEASADDTAELPNPSSKTPNRDNARQRRGSARAPRGAEESGTEIIKGELDASVAAESAPSSGNVIREPDTKKTVRRHMGKKAAAATFVAAFGVGYVGTLYGGYYVKNDKLPNTPVVVGTLLPINKIF